MEEQKGSDETDQQKKVKFDEEEPNEKPKEKQPANQEKDNQRDNKDRDDDDEDEGLGMSDDQKQEKEDDHINDGSYQNNSLNNKTLDKDSKNDDRGPDVKSGQQLEETDTHTAKTDEEKLEQIDTHTAKTDEEKLETEHLEDTKDDESNDVNNSEENISKAQCDDNSNTNKRQTSYSLNSRTREVRDSEGSNTEMAEDTKEDSKYQTDDEKVTKQDVTSPTRSTKSHSSAKYMNWEDRQSDKVSLKEEVNKTTEDEEEETTNEKKELNTSNTDTTTKDAKDEEKQEIHRHTEDNETKGSQKSLNSNSPKTKPPRQQSPHTANTVTLVTKRQSATKPPPQEQKKENIDRRQVSKSATYPSRKQPSRGAPASTRTSSRASTARSYRPPSRPRTTLGFDPDRRRENDFFHKELQRLKDSLRKESKTIKKPKVRDHYPDVFTSLAPYYNTYTANYLIKMPDLGYKEKQPPEAKKAEEDEERDIMYTSRCTAIGLCDPWDSLNMDKSVLPKLETAEIRKKRIEQMHAFEANKPKSARASSNTDRNSQSKQKRPEAKQGSTRLPKFPVIVPPNSDLTTKELHYGDVPLLRDEMIKSFSHYGEGRKQSDYNRTRQDFYRMELDRLEEYHHTTRPHMRAAYFAYLQNTPGSRKAIYDCMKETGKPKKKEEPTAQAVA